jgi:hypothetical protein
MSTRTSKADLNYLSVSNGVWGVNEGSDHAENLPGEPDWDTFSLTPPNARDYASLLKICDNSRGLSIPKPATGLLSIAQGQENAVDVNNRVASLNLVAHFGAGGQSGDQVITVKGGCHDLRFWGIIHSTGNNAEVVVGNWSDQCYDESYNLDFTGLVHEDGQPVTFILARCRDVKLPPGARVLRWKSLCLSAYWWAKWAAVKLHLLG